MNEHEHKHQQRTGLLHAIAAYGLWGVVPLFWPLLEPASAPEILANRMVWSLVTLLIALLLLRRWSWVRPLLRQPRRIGLIAVAAAVISVNWGFYIYGVNKGLVVETSLGYFINPLITICFGVVLLRERLRPAQWAAVGIGALAVTVLTIGYGQPPWISVTLAFSFAIYGLVKKRVALGGLESVTAETAVQFLPALGYLLYLGAHGQSTLTNHGAGHTALLATCGIVTAVPLILFGAATVRVPLTTLGLLQYLAPVLQFLCGLLYFHETMPPERWAGFVLVWIALGVLTWDALRAAAHGNRQALQARLTGRAVAARAVNQAPAAESNTPAQG